MTSRISLGLVLCCCLGALGIALAGAGAQQLAPGMDSSAQKILGAARLYVEEEIWSQALRALQVLLDRAEDSKVEVKRPGADKPVIVSAWAEAERMIQSMPQAGLEFYEKEYGPRAAQLMKEAKEFKADDLLAQTARRYRYTRSGVEATTMLAGSLLDMGKPKEAVQYFDRLLGWPGPDKLTPLTVYQAALAVRKAGDKPRSEELWKRVSERIGKDGLRMGDRTLTVEELRKELEKVAP